MDKQLWLGKPEKLAKTAVFATTMPQKCDLNCMSKG
jgi:hypothetical protein